MDCRGWVGLALQNSMGSRQYVDITIELMGNVLEHPSLDKSLNCLQRAFITFFSYFVFPSPPLSTLSFPFPSSLVITSHPRSCSSPHGHVPCSPTSTRKRDSILLETSSLQVKAQYDETAPLTTPTTLSESPVRLLIPSVSQQNTGPCLFYILLPSFFATFFLTLASFLFHYSSLRPSVLLPAHIDIHPSSASDEIKDPAFAVSDQRARLQAAPTIDRLQSDNYLQLLAAGVIPSVSFIRQL
ncbi:hypothetical protein FOXYSP1_05512 [Fusarium oxysporum f. sp. phaseoli]